MEILSRKCTYNEFLVLLQSLHSFTESHILEDVNKCVLALQEGDADTLDRTAGAIRGRSSRVCNVVGAEMNNYEKGVYTERVMEAVSVLRDQGQLSKMHSPMNHMYKFMYCSQVVLYSGVLYSVTNHSTSKLPLNYLYHLSIKMHCTVILMLNLVHI